MSFDRDLATQWASLGNVDIGKLPWERGYWRDFFDGHAELLDFDLDYKQPVPPLVPADVHVVAEPVSKKQKTSQPQSWVSIVKSSVDLGWKDKREADFQVGLRRWLDALLDLSPDLEVVQQLHSCGSAGNQLRMLRDIFHKKSPQTLLKRVHSFLRLKRYLRDISSEFPCSESMLYSFLTAERIGGAPNSRLQSVMEALLFMEYVLGMDSLHMLTTSRRCIGVASKQGFSMRRQASPFRLDELRTLHEVLSDCTENLWDRMLVGVTLCTVYSRSRWSDLQHAETCIVDEGESGTYYLEFPIGQHKTMSASMFKNMFLHACAPGLGVVDDTWASVWLDVRRELGIDFELRHPTMPAPLEDGSPGLRPLTTEEMKRWIHMILEKRGHVIGDRRLTSHSCKATLLSWLSKYGVSFDDRLILGGHVGHFKTALVYSRDSLGRPLRVLEGMLSDIRKGLFLPDESRSGRFVREDHVGEDLSAARCDDEVDIATKIEISSSDDDWDKSLCVPSVPPGAEQIEDAEPLFAPGHETDSSSDAVGGVTSSSSDDEGGQLSGARRPVTLPKLPSCLKMKQHRKLKTLHLMEKQNTKILVCGRTADPDRYEDVAETRFDTPCCVQCWKKRDQYVE